VNSKRTGKPASFCFSSSQRKWLSDTLRTRKFEERAIEDFLDTAEIRIRKWSKYLPATPKGHNREGSKALGKLEKHLTLALYELRRLPLAWRTPLWIDLEMASTPNDADVCTELTHEQAANFLRQAIIAVQEHLEGYERAGGRDYLRKKVLIAWIADAYAGAFGRAASATAEGPFMAVMRAIGEAAGMPIGKDAVAATIKAPWRYLRYTDLEP
jgi:hypothetical protein